MIITISGTAGSGKSTLSKNLLQELNKIPNLKKKGVEWIYLGKIRRDLAKSKGMTIGQLNEYAKTHPETDVDVDKTATKKAKQFERQGKTVIVEGRVQFHFLPKSIKIYVKVSPKIAANRIWKELQNKSAKKSRNEKPYSSVKELEKHIIQRGKNDTARYLKYYNVDDTKLNQYDFVIDTSNHSPKQTLNELMAYLEPLLN